MFDKISQRCLEICSIIGGTVVLFVLVIFPVSWRQIQTIFGILKKNMKIIPRFFTSLHQIRLEKKIPLWQIGLGFPFIAIFVLLEEYE